MDPFDFEPAQNDLADQIRTSLTPYKQIIPSLYSFFTWQKSHYPIMIFSFVSFSYLLVWLLETSVLSTLSILGIILTATDFFLPGIIANFCDSSKWDDKDDKLFDSVCTELSNIVGKFKTIYASWSDIRQKKSKYYYLIFFSILITLAWVGNTCNNLFLFYLLTLKLFLLPGMRHHNVLKKGLDKGLTLIKSAINKEKKDN